MAFLSDLRRFYGTGEKNTDGQSLEEFLEHNNQAKYGSVQDEIQDSLPFLHHRLSLWFRPENPML
mgnify:CR=1 FL=1